MLIAAVIIVIIASAAIFLISFVLSLVVPVAIVFTVLWLFWVAHKAMVDAGTKADDD